MKSQTLSYRPGSGWSAAFPALDSPSTLVMISAAPVHARRTAAIEAVLTAFPTSMVIGCAAVDDALAPLSVGILAFESTLLLEAVAHVAHPEDSRRAGLAVAETLDRTELAAALVLAAGPAVDGSALACGVTDVLGTTTAVSSRFDRAWVLAGGQTSTSAVVAVGLYGRALDVSRLNVQPPALQPADQTFRDVVGLTAIAERSTVRPAATYGLTRAS